MEFDIDTVLYVKLEADHCNNLPTLLYMLPLTQVMSFSKWKTHLSTWIDFFPSRSQIINLQQVTNVYPFIRVSVRFAVIKGNK